MFVAIMVAQSLSMIVPDVTKASEIGANTAGTAERVIVQKATIRPNIIPGPKGLSNPLWAISLDQLVTTRLRPLFSPTRRPPPAAAIAPVAAAPIVVALPPERPQLALVGTVVGDQEGIGVFIEQSTQKVFRLKMGDAYAGWILRSIQQRAVSLEKDGRIVVIDMPIAAVSRSPSSSSLHVIKQ